MEFMGIVASDELLGTFVPIVVYWLYAPLIVSMENSFPKYEIRSAEERDKRNPLVSKVTVIRGVVLSQVVQALTATLLYVLTNDAAAASVTISTTDRKDDGTDGGVRSMIVMLITAMVQFLIAMVVMDTWNYFMHRFIMHENKFFYKHIHSRHHRAVAPYAYAALYSHPLESLLVDTMGGAVSFLVSGMSPRTSIFFFSFATIKVVDDHSGVCKLIPWHPFHVIFRNNSLFHDVHHQLNGTKYNFSQPFFVFWDRILGSYYMPSSTEDDRAQYICGGQEEMRS